MSDIEKFGNMEASTECPPCKCGHSGWEHYVLRGECDKRKECGCQVFTFADQRPSSLNELALAVCEELCHRAIWAYPFQGAAGTAHIMMSGSAAFAGLLPACDGAGMRIDTIEGGPVAIAETIVKHVSTEATRWFAEYRAHCQGRK